MSDALCPRLAKHAADGKSASATPTALLAATSLERLDVAEAQTGEAAGNDVAPNSVTPPINAFSHMGAAELEEILARNDADRTAKKDLHHSSKYDLVKVRVWLSADHHYILSRFLVSRMLTVTKVGSSDAISISLDLKKLLIDMEREDVHRKEVEQLLFAIMRARGYGHEFIHRYQMMSAFHHQRVSMIILIGGTGCTAKSTLATQLAERLNLACVLQTELVYAVLQSVMGIEGGADYGLDFRNPLWYREDRPYAQFIDEYRSECTAIRDGLQGDIRKCMDEGKSIIIEGFHLDFAFYMDLLQSACNLAAHSRAAGQPLKRCVVIPFIMMLAPLDHEILVDNWIASHSHNEHLWRAGTSPAAQRQRLVQRFRLLGEHLDSTSGPQVHKVAVVPHALHDTLNCMHDIVLGSIETACTRLGFTYE